MMADATNREEIILPALLGEMLDRLGIDPERAQERGQAFATTSRRCLRCLRQEACASWLERARARAAAPAFCPNAGFLRRIAKA